jgi:signal transduction histidine kinase
VAGDFVDTLLAAGDGQRANPLLVVDRAGLVVAGRMLAAADRQRNWAADLDGAGLDAGGGVRQLRLADSAYDAGVARAVPPGWTFVVASPAGHANPRVRSAILAVLGGLAAALLLAAVLAPLWAAPMNAALRDLIAQTRALTSGGRGRRVTRGPILEFNQLASDMEAMAEATRQRQAELEQSQERLVHTLQTVQRLNLELESRVTRRTADLEQANRELSEAMARLRMAQGELVRSEKLASLGNLVGGIAHELNTPIGNGVMAVSTVNEQVREFRREMSEGLRRSHLASFVDRVERGSAIALRNLQRANELILGFKQVAVDQATVQRRPFLLAEVVDEILLTMQPALRRTRCRVTIRVAPGLELDSYPGPLGQVLSNLLSNALVHGFEGRPQGLVEITAAAAGPGQICLTFADDGVGIAPDMVDRIFDPFVTSKLGRGGTGLGLHIVWSTVTAVLGGSISVSSVPGEGTRFRIILPVTAPTQPAAA